ncbi:hypothetical protein [Puia sp.]|jgi:alpha-beta hydrolase superfamily lysophospholipase|uniref:esterase/lipase family protein n=1 Tax=Puia sp. TaxID=2045100 RepID=UPI002F42F3C4
MPINLVFVHGWSVTNLNTYGQLPLRLRAEFAAHGETAAIHEIWLARYISFHDEVQLADISRAFQAAIDEQLAGIVAAGERFIVITHSTGGPVLRDWWARYWKSSAKPGPMSHLIMLAPANFGSALAQLGKGTLGRLRSWTQGVQPGQGVLDWLELGSAPAWALNTDWITTAQSPAGANGFYPFVIVGQSIDRQLYDNLNSYTGEIGSDGCVRSAGANLNADMVIIKQNLSTAADGSLQDGDPALEYHTAPATPFLIVKGKSHSGDTMGIMTSIKAETTDAPSQETVNAILTAIRVANEADYANAINSFAAQTAANQQIQRLESVSDRLITLTKRYFIHDRFCMVIFRLLDTEGNALKDFDLLFTAGDNSPNHLPEGFFADRQQNSHHPETITYFVNYDILKGAPAVTDGAKTVREAAPGITKLGLQVKPRPDSGFVHYRPLEIVAQPEFFDKMVKPNSTILVDIRLKRLVSKEVFRLEGPLGPAMPDDKAGNFKDVDPGNLFVCC